MEIAISSSKYREKYNKKSILELEIAMDWNKNNLKY